MKHNDNFKLTDEIKKIPFLRIIISLIAGIIISLIFDKIPSIYPAILFFIFSILFILVFRSSKYSHRVYIGIIINLIFFFFGMFNTLSKRESAIDNLSTAKKGLLIGEITSDPRKNNTNVILDINIIAVKNKETWTSCDGKTLLYIEKDSISQQLEIGDKLIFNPRLSDIQNKGNPEEFDYRKYLAYNLILSSDHIVSDDWDLLKEEKNLSLNYKLLRFRQFLITELQKLGLSNDELAVTSALALGYDDNLSQELRHSYAASGAMHILAVSGMHVGIIYGIIVFALSFIKNKKYNFIKIPITILLIWLYAIISGLSPSVSRAALMFTIIAIGNLQNRASGSLNSVAISAFILLIINPYNITNIGFLLSYIAVIGIIIIQPKIYELIEVKNKILNNLWSVTSVSLAAQIVTAPLGIYYFNQMSNYFLITNYLLIPISTIAIWIVILIFVCSPIVFIAEFLTKSLSIVIKIMNEITLIIEKLPFAITDGIYITLAQLILIYLIIITITIFLFYSNKYKYLIMSIFALICIESINLANSIKHKGQKTFIVYNINKISAINIIDDKDNILFANIDQIDKSNIQFTAKNHWLSKGLDSEKYVNLSSSNKSILTNIVSINNKNVFLKNKFIAFENIKAFILDKSFKFTFEKDNLQKIKLDFLILSSNPDVNIDDIASVFDFKQIIIDSSNSATNISKWTEQNMRTNYKIHNVKTDGAFIHNLQF